MNLESKEMGRHLPRKGRALATPRLHCRGAKRETRNAKRARETQARTRTRNAHAQRIRATRPRVDRFPREVKVSGLWPREHGAYAQLGFPLVTGLLYARGDPGAWAFAAGGIALFLAHEPLAVLVGMRGVRLRDALVGSARRRLWLLAAGVAAALVLAAVLAPGRAWQGALIPGGIGLVLIPLFFTHRIKTMGGEIVVAAALSASVLPVALSGPSTWAEAWTAAAVWLGATLPAIASVHAVKASHKGRPRARWLVPAAPVLAVVVAGAGVGAAALLPPPAMRALAVLPPALAVVGVWVVRPHPRHLKRIGWAMVSAYSVALVLLLML
jgi:hypothetical protein